MATFSEQSCVACDKAARPVDQASLDRCLRELPGWAVVWGHGSRWLEKRYEIRDWTRALALIQQIGELAAQENHHPELVLAWGSLTVRWWTHILHDIHLNDCILAARCEALATQAN